MSTIAKNHFWSGRCVWWT